MTAAPVRPSLLLDIQGTQSVEYSDRGVARFVAEHARALLGIPGAVRGVLLNPQLPPPSRLPAELAASPLLRRATAAAVRELEAEGPAAYHVMSPVELSPPVETVLPPHLFAAGMPVVTTLYDLIPLSDPDRYLENAALDRRYRLRLEVFAQADLVLAISDHSRTEAIRILGLRPERVAVIGAGVSPFFHPAADRAAATAHVRSALPSVRSGYVMTVTGGDARKNTEGLLAAWARLPRGLRSRHQLVVTCSVPEWVIQHWTGVAARLGINAEEVVFTRYVDDRLLRSLYQAAELFVFPSIAEGFGLPLAEAIACRCPAITSDATSLSEVLDAPEAAFDPHDTEAMARLVERGLDDAGFRERLAAIARAGAGRHTWTAVARRTVDALDRLAPPPAPARRPRPLRIGLVGPLPPAGSGIANYNGRLVAALGRRCEVDVFSGAETARPARRDCDDPVWRRLPTRSLGRTINPDAYDALVYTVGNSEHHLDSYDAVRRHPGIVWFHDVRLGGLYRTYAHLRAGGGEAATRWMEGRIAEWYPDRVPRPLPDPFSAEAQARLGVGLTREWVAHADAVIVNSAFAARLLALDQAAGTGLPPVLQVPFAVPAPPPPAAPEQPPLVLSLGIVDPVKAPDLMLEALALVRRRVPARLALVGPVADAYRDELLGLAARLGVGDAVEVTGPVEEAQYWAWATRASVAVQLRRRTNGESSAAVADCLAAGLPVITTALGAALELPAAAVRLVGVEATAADLAEAVLELVEDGDARRGRVAAARAHAAATGFDAVAERLLEAIPRLTAPLRAAS